MDKYYYLVTQLPLLTFDQQVEYSSENFLAEAKKWLSSNDYASLAAVDLHKLASMPVKPAVLQQYLNFENKLRQELAEWRMAKKKNSDYKLETIANSVLTEGTPLDVEKRLLRLRWDYIEELALVHYFDIEFLILYMLKLQILERIASFDKEIGLETFQKLCKVEI